MGAAQNNKGVHRILVRPEIDTPEAIKGKKIAITTFGSSSHSVLTMVLEVWKIRPDELQILQIGSSPTMLLSLQKKVVDGAVLTAPSYFIAEDNGFRVIADVAKMNIHYLQSMMVSTRSYLRTNRDQATRVLRAYVEGIAYFKKNKPRRRPDSRFGREKSSAYHCDGPTHDRAIPRREFWLSPFGERTRSNVESVMSDPMLPTVP